ncbi:hypothetical protein AW27_030420 [Streptomyces sp. PCS3-D2]|uniref:hypothetical protein n=1 Tax=Streptomyces sp. PCS3-D2 TaxID=1460244 RepID=UPI00044FC0A8|nr:hypothetical protein [Streptomyces sp. PCS3-D2]WKV76508.1 hypothetical protein AW27_030420 [Streptomyces sp. PCS3-D2]
MANRIVEAAWGWTAGGRLPLVVDASSCTLGLAREVVAYLTPDNRSLHEELWIVDSVVWAAEVTARPFDAPLSANRMCEVGRGRATGRSYHSALVELERATRP